MNKSMDAAEIAAKEKCDLFLRIKEQITVSKILSNENIEISFETNPIIDKPEAFLAKVLDHFISIRAQVRTNPISGEVINDQPIIVSAWKSDSFNLKESCETPSEKEVVSKAFSSVDESVDCFFLNLESALSIVNN